MSNQQAEIFIAAVTVLDDYGLHARPAASLARAAQEFKADIRLISGESSADVKSILDLLSLAAGKNEQLTLECRGEDASAAGEVLTRLFQAQFSPTGAEHAGTA